MPLIGRPPKRPRTQSELAEMANRFRSDWRPGDNVMTWIRRHEGVRPELSCVVRDGWSWNDLGLAMAMAGIRYQTAAAISGELLRRKAGKARADERKRQTGEAVRKQRAVEAADPALGPGSASWFSSPLPTLELPGQGVLQPAPAQRKASAASAEAAASNEPIFRPVRLKTGHPPARVQMPAQPLPYPEAETELASDADIVRRVLGKV